VCGFIEAILRPAEDNSFLADFVAFQRTTAQAGMLNSLAQVLLKSAAPGVPDFYQGTELWHLCLVDPDNRRPVDYEQRKHLLASLAQPDGAEDPAGLLDQLLAAPADGRIKLYVTSRALAYRRAHSELFARGAYLPLDARGARADHVLAFARRHGEQEVLVLAGRFFVGLGATRTGRLALDPELWVDTALPLAPPAGATRYRDIFTGRELHAEDGPAGKELRLAQALAPLPVALLERL
jgi:(1->4)-alpha-D-glucan 1-alpha-D-glucosylmutase